MNYVLGLDVGIGSVGWAVIRNEEDNKRIEDFGVRVFASGENPKNKDRYSQERRGKRAARRLIRRRSHRKERLRNHLENIGLVSAEKVKTYYENCSSDIISLRVKALDERIEPEELAACLIHICNHRGYRDFYGSDDMTAEERKEWEEDNKAIGAVQKLMESGDYRTVSEMIAKDAYFAVENSDFRKYRNSRYDAEAGRDKLLFTRDMMQHEALEILRSQARFYPQLTENNIEKTISIIFAQRDFEDGPGNAEDKFRPYMGFIDSIGCCPFYKDEKRGFRFTLLADLFALVNVLSQYVYTVIETGEVTLPKELANALIEQALKDGNVKAAEIKKLAKSFGVEVNMKTTEKGDTLGKCLTFSKKMKTIFEKHGFSWRELAAQYRDPDALINRIAAVLCENITPKRRVQALKKIPELSPEMAADLKAMQASGTARVCERFMLDSVDAFLDGEAYGNFQANFIKKQTSSEKETVTRSRKLPPFCVEDEFYNNPVVIRSINETRKIINAVVEKYGSPQQINIETASDLNRSKEHRLEDERTQAKNQKANEAAVQAVAEITGKPVSEVNGAMVERYKLGEEQGWKCLYSGEPINDKKEAILNESKYYEVDHIVPFSLILDNTLKNKALVKHTENQHKGQRTPLMYMTEEQAKGFRARVNTLYGKKAGFAVKYRYLMLKDLSNVDLLAEWKSRNINDTRYIAKYLVRYIDNRLQFAENDGKSHVYAVKGAITSMMRRQWLNQNTWGTKDKAELKKVTYFDHAVDAIVIANCIPVYVEIVSLNRKLKDIFYAANNVETDEYRQTLEKGLESLFKFYQMPRRVAAPLLKKKKTVPSLIPDLRDEVEIRVTDCGLENYFAKKRNPDAEEMNEEDFRRLFRERITAHYPDKEFAGSIEVPLVSFKQERKVNKSIGDDTLLSLKEVDGELVRLRKKSISAVKKKEIPNIYTNDRNLIAALNALMTGYKDDATVEEALKSGNAAAFAAYRHVHSVKIKEKAPRTGSYMVKEIGEDNRSFLDVSSYYCVEIYKDADGKTHTAGIPYAFLQKKNGKLVLSKDYQQPADYAKHEIYLFPNDYVTIYGKDSIKFEGYYKGVDHINRSTFCFSMGSSSERKTVGISAKDTVIKHDVSILGKVGGEIGCGEPLLSIEASESH